MLGNNHREGLDDPETTIARRDFISRKPFFRKIYTTWYQLLKDQLPENACRILELGAGPGFCRELIPNVISSDLLFLPFVDLVLNGESMPLSWNSTDAVIMIDVFHHIPDAGAFLRELTRVLKPGGRVIMIEPWMTPWSRFVYKYFHHEALDMGTKKLAFSLKRAFIRLQPGTALDSV